MAIERERDGEGFVLARVRDCLANDLLVAQVSAVENADGQADFAAVGLQFARLPDDLHRCGFNAARARCGFAAPVDAEARGRELFGNWRWPRPACSKSARTNSRAPDTRALPSDYLRAMSSAHSPHQADNS